MIPTHIRATHPYGFRSGQWARLITTVTNEKGRNCYLVEFPDGVSDFWAVYDPLDPYEFEERKATE